MWAQQNANWIDAPARSPANLRVHQAGDVIIPAPSATAMIERAARVDGRRSASSVDTGPGLIAGGRAAGGCPDWQPRVGQGAIGPRPSRRARLAELRQEK
jgi:hypothetical protein